MTVLSKKTPFVLLFGDIVTFILSLWVALFIRYANIPDANAFWNHFYPFSVLFIIWVISYFITGLYENRIVVLKDTLTQKLLYAQFFNIVIAAVFFYFVTFTSITPKTNLIIYLIVSSIFLIFWRRVLYSLLVKKRSERAVLIGCGDELYELKNEIVNNNRYNLQIVSTFDLDKENPLDLKDKLTEEIKENNVSLIVIDLYNHKTEHILPELYTLLFAKVRFMDFHRLYESVFGRVALSLLDHNWFIENISAYPKYTYDSMKRIMDSSIAFVIGAMSLVIYPFVFLAIKLDDGGSIFIIQERIGKDGKVIKIPKFRSMKRSDRGAWVKENDDRITKVGKFLRKSRIDELPQLFSVIKGDMSLVGPRPDIHDLGIKLKSEIPYYSMRSIVKPGLSGWAQTRQSLPPQSLEETKIRLAYDFYYIKYRSFFLDLKIAMQTIETLLLRLGK